QQPEADAHNPHDRGAATPHHVPETHLWAGDSTGGSGGWQASPDLCVRPQGFGEERPRALSQRLVVRELMGEARRVPSEQPCHLLGDGPRRAGGVSVRLVEQVQPSHEQIGEPQRHLTLDGVHHFGPDLGAPARGRPSSWLSRAATRFATSRPITRYVVSLPPAIVIRPLGLSITRCSREASDAETLRAGASSGRSPAQVATTSWGARRAWGNSAFAERSR